MRYRIPFGVAAVVSAAVLLSACASSGSATDGGSPAQSSGGSGVVSLKVACSPSVQQVARDLAEKKGMETKAGVRASCVQVQTGPEQSAALVSGDLNVGIMTPSNMVPLLDKGQNLVIFGQIWNVNNFDILVRKGTPLPDAAQGWRGVMKDLKGKRIGVPARGAAGEFIARALFEEAGMPGSSASYIATGLPSTTLASLQSNAIDAAITYEPGITLALSQGIATQPFSLAKGTGPKDMVWADLLLVTTRSYAEKNKATLCKFTKAWDAGLQYLLDPARQTSVDEDAASFLGMKIDVAKTLMERNRSSFPTTTKLDASMVNPGFAFQKKYGGAKKLYTVADIGVDVCS